MSNREARRQRREARRKRRQDRIAARQQRRDERRARRQEARQTRRDTRQQARAQRKQARLSRKNAEKLQKIYGDMSPEDIKAINDIQPYVPEMAKELEEQGVQLNDPSDPVEVGTRYAQVEGDVDADLDQAIDEGYVEDENSWDDLEEDERREKRRGALRRIGGFIGEILPTAKRYFGKDNKGNPSAAAEVATGFQTGVRRERKQEFFTSPTFLILVGLVIVYAVTRK